MYYTIGIFEEVHGDLKVYFDCSGNEYVVMIRNSETKICTNKRFKNRLSAVKAYQEVIMWFLEGLYSEEDKRTMLTEMID